MKRSAKIGLTLMGTVAATTLLALYQRPKPVEARPFATVQECVASGQPAAECTTAYETALRHHEETAPRYATREACMEKVDVDNCVETRVRNTDGSFSNVFMPLMAGYLVGNLMNRPQQQPEQYSGGSSAGGSSGGTAVYRSRDYPNSYRDTGDLRTSREPATSRPGATSVSTRPPNINTTTIARSGFGSSSHSVGSSSS